jgi:hypothetical protein
MALEALRDPSAVDAFIALARNRAEQRTPE